MSATLDRLKAALTGRYRVDREVGAGGMATVFRADGLLYYVVPYVDGQSLRQRLAHERELPIGEAVIAR